MKSGQATAASLLRVGIAGEDPQQDRLAEKGRRLPIDRLAVELARRPELDQSPLPQHGNLIAFEAFPDANGFGNE
mgnify:CR=1 FL=1